MKYSVLLTSVIGLLVLAVACKRRTTVAQQAGDVIFARAGILLTVGEGWQRIDLDPGVPVCPPTLVSDAGMVRAMIFDANRPDPETAATKLRAAFEANSDAIKDSFRQEDFTTETGLQGVHLSYTARSQKDGASVETRSHNYVVKNREGRCVAISYTVPARAESDAVHQMVRKTLKLR
jgi:hypothetical protein